MSGNDSKRVFESATVINARCGPRVRWRVRVALGSSRIRRVYEALEIEDNRSCNVIGRRRRSARTVVYARHVDDDRAVDIIGRIRIDRHEQ